jgi:hypothetical protein
MDKKNVAERAQRCPVQDSLTQPSHPAMIVELVMVPYHLRISLPPQPPSWIVDDAALASLPLRWLHRQPWLSVLPSLLCLSWPGRWVRHLQLRNRARRCHLTRSLLLSWLCLCLCSSSAPACSPPRRHRQLSRDHASSTLPSSW